MIYMMKLDNNEMDMIQNNNKSNDKSNYVGSGSIIDIYIGDKIIQNHFYCML